MISRKPLDGEVVARSRALGTVSGECTVDCDCKAARDVVRAWGEVSVQSGYNRDVCHVKHDLQGLPG